MLFQRTLITPFSMCYPKVIHLDAFRALLAKPVIIAHFRCRILTGSCSHVPIRDVLEGPVSAWAAKAQRGFIKGRVMLSNVLDVEARAVELGADQNVRGTMLLFDFEVVFPSISHTFLRMAIAHAGIPEQYAG